jgi:hypothetical protein
MVEKIEVAAEELEGQRLLDIFTSRTGIIIYTDQGLYLVSSSTSIDRVAFRGSSFAGSTITGVDIGINTILLHFEDGLIVIVCDVWTSTPIFRLESRLVAS